MYARELDFFFCQDYIGHVVSTNPMNYQCFGLSLSLSLSLSVCVCLSVALSLPLSFLCLSYVKISATVTFF